MTRRPRALRFERLEQPLAPMPVFIQRLAANLVLVLVMVAVSLAVGMIGYHALERMSWIDAFANASMILSGMGPLGELHSFGAKLFAGLYALYSGLFLIIAAGIILAPLLHRLLHSMHLADEGDQ
jgi:hypothetical protein